MYEGRTPSRRYSSRPSSNQWHSHSARRLHPGRSRAVRPARHPDGGRRGDGGIWTYWKVVRHPALGHRAGSDDHGQRTDVVVPSVGRRRDAPACRREVRLDDVLRWSHYSSHPVSLAASLATLRVYEEDASSSVPRHSTPSCARITNAWRQNTQVSDASHWDCSASSTCPEREPYVPMTRFNATSEEMTAVAKYLREHDVYTMFPTTRSYQSAAVYQRGRARAGVRDHRWALSDRGSAVAG